ncbi:malate/lactate/ureidoglycolate dehydrogenase [soil metagenome]
MLIQAEPLTDFVSKLFLAAGASEESASLVARALVATNLTGHDSHGVIRVSQYLDAIADGRLDPAATPVTEQETDTITLVDGRHTFGQVVADFGIRTAIAKAKTKGIAATGLKNAQHVGRLGEWVERAAQHNLIGLGFCNGGTPGGLVTPFGGAGRFMGTNPFAAAVPVEGRAPVVVDFATSVVAEGKVRLALNKGEPLAEGRIQDKNGHASTAPEDLYDDGALLPMGEHKGSGLAFLMELLGGLLLGQGSPKFADYGKFRNGVLFIVLSVEAFRPVEPFLAESLELSDLFKATPAAPGVGEVLLPGEPEQRTTQKRLQEGIPIDEATWAQLVERAGDLEVAVPEISSGSEP